MMRFEEIEKQFSSISHLIESKNKRSAWFAGVGSLMKNIFGTLDEEDALVYNSAIQSIFNNENKISSLVKENILVTNSIISKFNETILKLQKNEHQLNEAIDNFTLILKNISVITERNQIQLSINNIFSSLEISIITLSFKLDDIINAIVFSSINKLHPAIITPMQLYKELINNYRNLPQGLELPTPLELNMIHTMTNISKVLSYYMDNKLIFVLQIPLVSTMEYNLYHNIPLPIPHISEQPDSFSLIIPTAKYIAITIDKNHYFDLDNLNNCILINYNNLICNVANVYTSEYKPVCESELLSKVVTKMPNQCETKFIYGKINIWEKINNNKWLFVQSEPRKVTIQCSNLKLNQEKILLGTGILNLPELCIGYSKNVILISKINRNISIPTINFQFNLIQDPCCNRLKFNKIKESVSPIHLENINLDNLKHERNLLSKQLLDTQLVEEMPHIIKYETYYSTTVIITTIIILILICYFCKGKCVAFKEKFRIKSNPAIEIELDNISIPSQPRLRTT